MKKLLRYPTTYLGILFMFLGPMLFGQNAVTIYSDFNYGGSSKSFGEGLWNMSDLGIGNDNLSSLKVSEGYRVILYEHDKGGGAKKDFTSNASSVGDSFNNKTTSLRVKRYDEKVLIYEHEDFGGHHHGLTVGEHHDSGKWSGVGNDNVSSVRVKPGYKIIIYENGGLSGGYRAYTADDHKIDFNDKASSILVVDLNVPTKTFTPATNKLYVIHTKKDNNKVLDAYESGLRIWTQNNSPAQKFKFVPAGQDSNGIPLYYIRTELSYTADDTPKAIEIENSGTGNGTAAICRFADEETNQKFRIFDEGNGYVSFSPACGSVDVALDLFAGNTAENSPIKVWDTNGTPDHRKFKLEDMGTDDTPTTARKTLLIYFNGSDKTLSHQLSQLATKVNADIQIYVNGVGGDNDPYHNYNNKGIKFSYVDKRMNHYSHLGINYYADFNTFTKQGTNARIYGINRDYDGSAIGGYENEDSKQVCREVLKLIKFYNVKNIDRVVISGHSRGAAVGISSFLFALKKAEEGHGDFSEFKSTVQSVFGGAQQINVISLDPVAGQGGNDYHMGGSWHIDEAYSFLNNKYNITYAEIYANAARMIDEWYKGGGGDSSPSFNPAKKYLHQTSGIDVHRYWLGFRHSSMVNEGELMYQYYDQANIPRPINLTADYINAAFNDQSLFRNKGHWANKFYQNDLAAYNKGKALGDDDFDELKNMYPKRHEKKFTNQSGQTVYLNDFIGSHNMSQ